MTRATFDIIGLSAFGYVFDSLRDPTEEVYLAYRNMFDLADRGSGLMTLVRIYFPWLEYFLVSDANLFHSLNNLITSHSVGQRNNGNEK